MGQGGAYPRGETRAITLCGECPVRHHCLPDHLGQKERARLENSLQRIGPLEPGERIFRNGDPFRHLGAVFSGSAKSTWEDRAGREHIAAFHLPGDLLGADALHSARHRWDVVAVSTVYACRFEAGHIQDIAQNVAGIRRQVLRLLSREIMELEQPPAGSAARRVSGFLRDWSERLAIRGQSPHHFVLPMSRRELASHLNLTPETVSRAFRRLVDTGILQAHDHEIRILDGAGLAGF